MNLEEKIYQQFFAPSCGHGVNANRAAVEWFIGKEVYEICPECGEDPKDCTCGDERIKVDVCFCMN